MSAAALLHRLHTSGVVVKVSDGALKIDAPAPLPDALLADLRAHKPELIALIQREAVNDCGKGEAASPLVITREFDPDRLDHWLRDEGLALVLRDGVLVFTRPNTQDKGEPSVALRQHVDAHDRAIVQWLTGPLAVAQQPPAMQATNASQEAATCASGVYQ